MTWLLYLSVGRGISFIVSRAEGIFVGGSGDGDGGGKQTKILKEKLYLLQMLEYNKLRTTLCNAGARNV